MKELSVFVDESGDYGEYDYRSPYYIVTLLFHDQAIDVAEEIWELKQSLSHIEKNDEKIISRYYLEYNFHWHEK